MLSSFKGQVVLEAVKALDTDGSPVRRSRLGQWCISPADPYAGRLADVSAASKIHPLDADGWNAARHHSG
jgi:hypothetical protein